MQPAHREIDTESAALAAVYRLLRELGKRRLASQANVDESGSASSRSISRELYKPAPPNSAGDAVDGRMRAEQEKAASNRQPPAVRQDGQPPSE